MSSQQTTQALQHAIVKMLRPLVRILLRNGVSFAQFADIAKRAYVDVATEEFTIPGKAQTTSRISTLTGLTRKDVLRIKKQPDDENNIARYNRAARVINAWISEATFQDKNGNAAKLAFEGQEPSFTTLVKHASGDITPRTILDELIHVGAVTQDADGRLTLLTRAYIPDGDDAEKIHILGNDVSDLITTIGHNIRCDTGANLFQRKVCYDNLPEEAIAELKQSIARKAQAALESMNDDMILQDRDSNKNIAGTGRVRAGLGIYYFEEHLKEDDDDA